MADLDRIRADARQLLLELIEIPTVRGREGDAMGLLCDVLATVTDEARLVPVDDALVDDPQYAFPLQGHGYADTPNLVCRIEGSGDGPAVLLNTHMDVVPASDGQHDAFAPTVADGTVFGRGACDAKGQIATLYALAAMLQEDGPPPMDVLLHVVIEEEVGGNGTLALVRDGVDAGAAVVLEPSDLQVFQGIRGAVWFRLVTTGRAAHSGSSGARVSALDTAVEAISILRDHQADLLASSRGDPLFDVHDDPMPLTFGRCRAGSWPATVPSEAVVEGVQGFLPGSSVRQVQEAMRERLRSDGGPWLSDHSELSFPMLNNEGYRLPDGHPLVDRLVDAGRSEGFEPPVAAMTASCDAWLYNELASVPTVVFGPGSLAHAHGRDEQIAMDDIVLAARILSRFLSAGPVPDRPIASSNHA